MPQWLTRHKWLWIAAAALIVLFAFAACDDDEEEEGVTPVEGETPTAAEPLKIGVLVAFTGDLSDFGPEHENAALLAAKEINAAGGVLGQDIEIVTGDTGTDPSQGATEATRLVEVENVDVILGALSSGVTLQIAESVTGPGGVLQISPASTSVAVTEANDNDFLFRTTVSDLAQGPVTASLALEEGFTSVCNMYINNAYGEGLSDIFAENFEEGGGTVTAKVPHESEQATYASELAQCEGADAIAGIAYPESAGVFLREAVEAGTVDSYIFVDGTYSGAMFEELGWANFDGFRGTATGANLDIPTGSTFDAAYEAEYGAPTSQPFVREMYDATYLVALATEVAGSTDPADIRDALRGVSGPPGEAVTASTGGFTAALDLIAAGTEIDYQGAAGPVDLDENGDVLVGAIQIWRVDAASETLVTERVFRADLVTGEVTEQ